MKLRIKSLFMIAALLLLSSGCNSETTPVGEDDITQDSAPESGEDPDSLTLPACLIPATLRRRIPLIPIEIQF